MTRSKLPNGSVCVSIHMTPGMYERLCFFAGDRNLSLSHAARALVAIGMDAEPDTTTKAVEAEREAISRALTRNSNRGRSAARDRRLRRMSIVFGVVYGAKGRPVDAAKQAGITERQAHRYLRKLRTWAAESNKSTSDWKEYIDGSR